MAIGIDQGPGTGGTGGTYGSGVDRNQTIGNSAGMGSTLPPMNPGESQDDYWKRLHASGYDPPGGLDSWLQGAGGTSSIDPGMWDKFNLNADPFTGLLQKQGFLPVDPISSGVATGNPVAGMIPGNYYTDPNAPGPWGPGGGVLGQMLTPKVGAPTGGAGSAFGGSGMGDPFAGLSQGAGAGGAPIPGAAGSGTPIPGAEGLNFLKPGAAESYFDSMKGNFSDPTMMSGYAKSQLDKYGSGAPGVSNNAQSAYDDFSKSTPADMSSYYANAERQAQERINKAMAARGTYASSGANDLISEAFTNLEADRAKNEAGYGLSRAGLAGTLGSAADASSLAGSTNARNWMTGLGDLAGASDNSSLSRWLGGMSAAQAAQGAQRSRGQDMFNNSLDMGKATSGVMNNAYGNMFANDKDLFGQYLAGLVGAGSEQQGQATRGAAQQRADMQSMLDMAGNFSKLYQGASGAGSKP